MDSSSVTSKGQVTIPKEIRRELGIRQGSRIAFAVKNGKAELRVLRGKDALNVRATIAPPQDAASTEGKAVPQIQGMSVVEIERDSALFRQLKGGGLVVAGVERDSRAFRAGFRPGDIIYGVNRRRVRTLAEFQAALRAGEGSGLVVADLERILDGLAEPQKQPFA